MKYKTIYADPPWNYRVYSKKGLGRSAESHYPTMSIEEIRAMSDKSESEILPCIRPVDSVFGEYGSVKISESQTVRFNNGGGLMLSRVRGLQDKTNGTLYRVYSDKNIFLGLGTVNVEKDELSVRKRFLSE